MVNSTVAADVSAVATPAAEGKAASAPAKKAVKKATAAPKATPEKKEEKPVAAKKATPAKKAAKPSEKPTEVKAKEAPKATAKKTAKKVTEAPKPVGKKVSEKVLVGDDKKTTPAAKKTAKKTTEATPAVTEGGIKVGVPQMKILKALATGGKTRKELIELTGIKTGFVSLLGHASNPEGSEACSLCAKGLITIQVAEEGGRGALHVITQKGLDLIK